MTPEKKVQNSIIKYLKDLEKSEYPIYVERRQAGGFNYHMGISDLYVIIDGIHLEIEVKKPGGKLSPLQEKWRDKCIKKRIRWICADSLQDVINKINEILNQNH